MIIVNLTIYVGIADPKKPWDIHELDFNQVLREALVPTPERRAQLHEVTCTICNDWTQWYESPGKARMGLSGHQSWCRRRPSKHPVEG